MDDDRRCTATSKRSGQRCKKAAVVGASVCHMHGMGRRGAPQRRAAEHRAARLEAHRQAERMVARAGVDADPIEHLLDSLYRAAALVEVWGAMVAGLDAATADEVLRGELRYFPTDDGMTSTSADQLVAFDKGGMAKVHPYVVEYHSALERRAKFAKLALDAGVAERSVRIAEDQARQVAEVIRATLDELDLDETAKAGAVRRAASHLRLVEDVS